MVWRRFTPVLGFVLALSGCSWMSGPPAVEAPVSYLGDVSCPGCPARVWTLTLWPDGYYRLRDRYPQDQVFYDAGQWTQTRHTLRLTGAQGIERRFRRDGDHWVWVQPDGAEANDIKTYRLLPKPDVDWIQEPMPALGRLQQTEDGWRWQDCFPARRWQLRTSEAATQRLREQTGVLLAFQLNAVPDTWLSVQLSHDDAAQAVTLHRVETTWPLASCPSRLPEPAVPLQGPLWRLTHVEGAPIKPGRMQRVPSLRLRGQELSGHTGCNPMSAQLRQQMASVSVQRLAGGRMFCGGDTAQLESRLLQHLRTVNRQLRHGNEWILLQDDQELLRWQAHDRE